MGILRSDDEDEQEDEHICSDYEVIERGNWKLERGPIVRIDELVVKFKQEVAVRCKDCGETERGIDNTRVKKKVVPFEDERIEEQEATFGDVTIDISQGHKMYERGIDNVDGIEDY